MNNIKIVNAQQAKYTHHYNKLCVRNIILALVHLLVLLCELLINAQT